MFDLTITGGSVVDGTGAPARNAAVAVKDGIIVEVGAVTGRAARTIDARGALVTPGFIDIHTHYDGQATWDTQLDPSFSSGVTTAIFGNCGVGFAPVRPGDEQQLIELMEGVEEIPGTALHAGLQWNWSSFPEYLDVLDSPHSFDIGALLPHGPLRRHVMGEKVGTDKCASGADLAAMTRLVDEAMAAGAFGLSSSRTRVHRTVSGEMTDDFNVDEPELQALVAAVARHGGYVELAPLGAAGEDHAGLQSEMRMYQRILDTTATTLHLPVVQTDDHPDYCFEQLKWAETVNAKGFSKVYAQVAGRSVAGLLSFHGLNPFMDRPTLLRIKREFPGQRWLAELRRPEVKAAILSEENPPGGLGAFINGCMNRCYDTGATTNYEPDESHSVTRLAARTQRHPASVVYDLMVETSDHPRVLVAIQNYVHENLDAVARMLSSPASVLSLSDAGAHVQSVCDGSIHPFMLTHWVRDRKRGARMALEAVIRMMTLDCAQAVGLHDRGVIAPGRKADINIVDLDALTVHPARFFDDLPAGASRLMQPVSGFRATLVAGVATREGDQPSGALPGKLLRYSRLKTAA
jgi:N-acyl-D-amino-acid deacylase